MITALSTLRDSLSIHTHLPFAWCTLALRISSSIMRVKDQERQPNELWQVEQQTEKYKADLESTQSTQSTESGVTNESGAKAAQLA